MRRLIPFVAGCSLLLALAPAAEETPSALLRREIVGALQAAGRPPITLPRQGAAAAALAPHTTGSAVATPRLDFRADCDALRAAVDGDFNTSSCAKLLETWGLANARSMSVRADLVPAAQVKVVGLDGTPRPAITYSGPPMARVEVSWSARSKMPGTVARSLMFDAAWPNGIGIDPPKAPWIAVTRVDPLGLGRFSPEGDLASWSGIAHVVIDSIGLTDSGSSAADWVRARSGWLNGHEELFRKVNASLGRWIIVGGVAEADAIFIIAETTGNGERAEAASADIAASFKNAVTTSGDTRFVKPGNDRLIPSFAWTTRKIGTRVWMVAVVGADASTPVTTRVEQVAKLVNAPAPSK